MRTTRRLVSLAVLTAALAAASCGSDDSSPSPVAPLADGGSGDGGPKVVLGAACDAGAAGQAPAPSCSTPRAVGTPADAGLADAGDHACASDTDCTAGENGRCSRPVNGDGLQCSYDQCTTDTDCGAMSTCLCGTRDGTASGVNLCVESECASDADCGAGFTCALSGDDSCGAGSAGYHCHSAKDDCLNDCDCASQGGLGCVYASTTTHWYCAPASACPGGPR